MDELKTLRGSIYVGAFIHCKTLQQLEICDNSAIGVDEHGVIQFVERDAPDAHAIARARGWAYYGVVRASSTQFFFPGFVGELRDPKPPSPTKNDYYYYGVVTKQPYYRHAYPCTTIPQRWNLWKYHVAGMAEQIHLPYGSVIERPRESEKGVFSLCASYSVSWDYDRGILRYPGCRLDEPPRGYLPICWTACVGRTLLHESHVS